MSSQRLPGKVLAPVMGSPMLARQIERIGRAKDVDRLVLATSSDPSDDAVAALGERLGVDVFRGDLHDVLDRVWHAADAFEADYVVRLTGDCPLCDSDLIDRVIRFCRDGGYDYASNTLSPTFPDGLDVEVMRQSALAAAWREARLPSERQHVTMFLKTKPERFKLGNFTGAPDLSAHRWTVDEPGDLEMVRRVFEALYPGDPGFTTADVLRFLTTNPAVAELNRSFARDEGLHRSLAEDKRQQMAGKLVP
jgi:spore coat polysaccharide biosynthesis protein SpsF